MEATRHPSAPVSSAERLPVLCTESTCGLWRRADVKELDIQRLPTARAPSCFFFFFLPLLTGSLSHVLAHPRCTVMLFFLLPQHAKMQPVFFPPLPLSVAVRPTGQTGHKQNGDGNRSLRGDFCGRERLFLCVFLTMGLSSCCSMWVQYHRKVGG